jgi:hypothetical protein
MVGIRSMIMQELVAMCQHFELTNDSEDLIYISILPVYPLLPAKTAHFELCKRTKKIHRPK